MFHFSPIFLAMSEKLKNSLPRTSVGKEIASPREQLIILGIALGLGALLFLWVFFFRKPKMPETAGNKSSRILLEAKSEKSHSGRRRRKWREKRRDHRPRNPTLSETGGLPPTRPGDSESEA